MKYPESTIQNITYLERCTRKEAKAIYDTNRLPGLVYHHESTTRYYTDSDGKLQGPFKEWHINGTLFTEGNYKDGYKDGYWRDWYGNGQLWEEIDYRMGRIHGHYRYYGMDGELLIHRLYRDDEILGYFVEKEVFPPIVEQ